MNAWLLALFVLGSEAGGGQVSDKPEPPSAVGYRLPDRADRRRPIADSPLPPKGLAEFGLPVSKRFADARREPAEKSNELRGQLSNSPHADDVVPKYLSNPRVVDAPGARGSQPLRRLDK